MQIIEPNSNKLDEKDLTPEVVCVNCFEHDNLGKIACLNCGLFFKMVEINQINNKCYGCGHKFIRGDPNYDSNKIRIKAQNNKKVRVCDGCFEHYSRENMERDYD